MADLAGELGRTESWQYPQSHVGHMTNAQAQRLDKFKQICEKQGYYRPATATDQPASHHDETLL